MRLGCGLAGEKQRPRVQALQAHQRPDALVQWMLVPDHAVTERDGEAAASAR